MGHFWLNGLGNFSVDSFGGLKRFGGKSVRAMASQTVCYDIHMGSSLN